MKFFAFFSILALLLLNGCEKEKGVTIIVENVSEVEVREVRVSSSEELEEIVFEGIQSGQTAEAFLSMKENKMDGSFTIKAGDLMSACGYYTNGSPLDDPIQFVIHPDSITCRN
jgi:hypothetical protein